MVPAVSVPLSVKVGGLISTLAFGFAAGTVVQAASLTTAIITTLIAVIGLAWTISKANKRNVQAAELELRTARAEDAATGRGRIPLVDRDDHLPGEIELREGSHHSSAGQDMPVRFQLSFNASAGKPRRIEYP